jgi:hypothetical protein
MQSFAQELRWVLDFQKKDLLRLMCVHSDDSVRNNGADMREIVVRMT